MCQYKSYWDITVQYDPGFELPLFNIIKRFSNY